MKIEPVKNICKIIGGNAAPKDSNAFGDEGTPFVKMKDFGKYHLTNNLVETENKVTNEIALRNRLKLIKKGSILLPRSGSVALNHRAILGIDAYIVSHICALEIINPNDVYNQYLYYYLTTITFDNILKKTTGLDAITFEDLAQIKIPIPSLTDQIKIATLLSKAEALIKQRKENIDLLDEFLKSVFLKMFGNPVKNEKGWEKIDLKHFGEIITGNTPSRSKKENYSSNFIEWVKTDNITTENTYITNAVEYLSEQGLKNARTVDNGALLVACIAGSIESIGRAALSNRTVSFNQQINAIQPNKDVSPLYLYWLFKISKKYIQNHATKGMKRILTKGEFEKIKMIKPFFEIQKQFAVIAENREAINQQLKSSLSDLENLYGSLSQRAFNGDLEILTQKIIDSIEKELTLMEHGGNINEQDLSNSTEKIEALSRQKQLETHRNDIRQKELIISILKGDKIEVLIPDIAVKKNGETERENPKLAEDKPYSDHFEVDEETAKKKGAKFYKEWKKMHPPKVRSKITWDKVSSQQVAEWIKEKYESYHFSTEMLIRFLMDQYVVFPDYYSSEELKKYPQLNGADDIKSFIFSAINNENPFIKLEQNFYNAEKETFQLNVTEEDYELIKSREGNERSGIYLSIVQQ